MNKSKVLGPIWKNATSLSHTKKEHRPCQWSLTHKSWHLARRTTLFQMKFFTTLNSEHHHGSTVSLRYKLENKCFSYQTMNQWFYYWVKKINHQLLLCNHAAYFEKPLIECWLTIGDRPGICVKYFFLFPQKKTPKRGERWWDQGIVSLEAIFSTYWFQILSNKNSYTENLR